ncbi:MAG: DMT family transporter [Rhizobiales bacterium]|nr:DMT family transporter [Hyphomicrobiales bacterium]
MTVTAEPQRLPSRNLRGAGAFGIGTACLVANDTIVKLASVDLPIGQLIFVRGCFAVGLVLAVCAWMGVLGQYKRMAEPAVVGRAVVNTFAMFAYIAALIHMPIANVSAITQAIPLALTAASAVILGEKVRARRWSAVAVGFLGVLIIIRPGTGAFNLFAFSALLAVVFVTARDLLTRSTNTNTPSILITLASALAVMFASGAYSLFESWAPLETRTLVMLAVAAAFLMLGIHMLIVGVRIAELSVVVPFRYLLVVWAMLSGYLVWGEFPDSWALFGIALIVGSGIYTVRREASLKGSP